ncbi:hypothetical protein L226DRAFT_485561 [Lentinus tigrinus ALCF2SS1-7]|uniref:uncharacterized protein n=1 Tax=Lentinus tigrinus ALCF2SS1-7 TaxID=1328758 RepID=UPI0011660C87|nr:hypothetical protein L226DRAFT_485561 [Lentinus tigrinus ALCF2SS1-7]
MNTSFADSVPARKRTRHDEDAPQPQGLADLTRDKEFWLDDGSIVLITQKTAFKVYKGLLAAQSPVFADMVATATPDPEHSLEGCPVVHLSDSPEDMRHFLRALLPKTHRCIFVEPGEKAFTFMQLSALVRLAHKYQVEDIQSQAIATLKKCFSDNFQDWNADESCIPFAVPENPAVGIEVIHLARLTDTPKLLPSAFYFCITGGSKVLDGWRREDGTVVRLEVDDLKKLFSGYGKLQRMTDSFKSSIYTLTPSQRCGTWSKCLVALLAIQGACPERYPEPSLLDKLEEVIEYWQERHGLCSACGEMLRDNEKEARFKVWKSLPTLFELTIDDWESE